MNEKGREKGLGEGKREGGVRPWSNIKFQASAHSKVILVSFRIGIFRLSQQKMKASVLRNSNHMSSLLLLPQRVKNLAISLYSRAMNAPYEKIKR